jgi:hypothetical protein
MLDGNATCFDEAASHIALQHRIVSAVSNPHILFVCVFASKESYPGFKRLENVARIEDAHQLSVVCRIEMLCMKAVLLELVLVKFYGEPCGPQVMSSRATKMRCG